MSDITPTPKRGRPQIVTDAQIFATIHLPANDAAEQLGVKRSTIYRRRAQLRDRT